MATVYQISENDSATEMTGKVNQSMSNLKYAVEHSEGGGGEGGGGSTSNDVISRNADAVNRIQAAKKHFDNKAYTNSSFYDFDTYQGCFCIAHGSDFHVDVKRFENYRDFVDGVDMIDAAIVTGDFTSNGSSTEFASMLGVQFSRKQPMLVFGNHERGDNKTVAQIASEIGLPVSETGGYYYRDFTDAAQKKFRIIVLNEYDTEYTAYNDATKGGVFSQAQITWLLGVLDDAITNGFNVLIARHEIEKVSRTHSPYANNAASYEKPDFWQRSVPWQNYETYVCSGTIIEDIVAAFRAGGTINQTYTYSNKSGNINADVIVNHTFSAAGNFVAYMVGHDHADGTGYSVSHRDQLYLQCPASCFYSKAGRFTTDGGKTSDLPRFENTKSEDCFNIYAIDTINKLVKVVRVGADTNDLMEKREMACYNYQPSNS